MRERGRGVERGEGVFSLEGVGWLVLHLRVEGNLELMSQ